MSLVTSTNTWPTLLMVLLCTNFFMISLSIDVNVANVDPSASPILTQDITPPTVNEWDIIGEVTEDFIVYARVIDSGSGIENVSLLVDPHSAESHYYLLESNGTHYIGAIPALPTGDTYRLSIVAYDNAGNRRDSYWKSYDLRITTSTIDPAETMPAVITGSLLAAIIVLVFAYRYDQKEIDSETESGDRIRESMDSA